LGNIPQWVNQHNFHPGSFFLYQQRVIYFVSIHNAKVWLFVFFVQPQVTKHFTVIAINRHAIFPGFGYFAVEGKYDIAQSQQTTF